jgi:hypothetical protein
MQERGCGWGAADWASGVTVGTCGLPHNSNRPESFDEQPCPIFAERDSNFSHLRIEYGQQRVRDRDTVRGLRWQPS